MKYVLEPFYRNVSDEDLLADLRMVAESLEGRVTNSQYTKLGKFSAGTLITRFGTWNNALERASLQININRNFTEDDLLNDLRRVAAESQAALVPKIYNQLGAFGVNTILRSFGKWTTAIQRAGLSDNIKNKRRSIKEAALLNNIETVWLHLGKQPRLSDLNDPPSIFKEGSYVAFWGSWRAALEQFVSLVSNSNEDENDQPRDEKTISIQDQISIRNSRPAPATIRPNKRTPRNPNLRLRWQVYQRDNFQCVACGRSPAKNVGVELHVDHVIPYSKEGETVLENLRLLCSDCNLGKSDT